MIVFLWSILFFLYTPLLQFIFLLSSKSLSPFFLSPRFIPPSFPFRKQQDSQEYALNAP